MLATAFVVGIVILQRNAHLVPGLRKDRVVDCVLFMLVLSLAGARALYVLLNLNQFDSIKSALSVQNGGLSFHGGLLGGMLGVALFCRFYKAPFLPLVDIMAPAGALGYAITKIGCFLNGCCIGRPTGLPWGVCFPDPNSATPGALTAPSHPVQIYDCILNVILCLVLLRALHRKRFHGQTFFLWLILYSVVRFLVEFARKGITGKVMFSDMTAQQAIQSPMFAWPPTQAQVASAIAILIIGAVFLIRLRTAPKEPLPVPPVTEGPTDEDQRPSDKRSRRRKDRKARRRRDNKPRES
jgi:phosphatidylglycerol:prolipoprotein diacylglycerol transferase